MRALIFGVLSAFLLFAAPKAEAQAADIQGIITSQIEAFKADDFETAFTFAHPRIQGMFRNPGNFGRMVTQGYPMVWRPADVRYLPLREKNGFTFQDVEIVDEKGQVFVLEYAMAQTSDGWRIAGVRILENNAYSA